MKRLSLLSLMILLISMTIGAQIRGNNITVTVQPDHNDWNYHSPFSSLAHRCPTLRSTMKPGR